MDQKDIISFWGEHKSKTQGDFWFSETLKWSPKHLLNSGLPAFLQVAEVLHLFLMHRLHPSVLH